LSALPRGSTVEDRLRAHFTEQIEWSDPEQVLDTAGAALCDLRADSELLLEAFDELSAEQLDPSLGAGGAYWFKLAESSEDNLSIWIRFCPTGCVAPAHTHRSEVLALVVCGTFKQTLIGHGGGVASPDNPIKLYVRHERPGQVFAFNERQQHETSSTAGSLILAVMPATASGDGLGGASPNTIDPELSAKVETAILRLRRSAREGSRRGRVVAEGSSSTRSDRPVLFHVHGIGEHDFSSLRPEELESVQRQAEARGIDIVPTIFLRKEWLAPCENLLGVYDRTTEQFPNILGFAIEGPLLGPSGGTPHSASWMPSVTEWTRIASLGRVGLRYLVLAPDAMETEDMIAPGFRLLDLIESLLENGVRIALGHFERSDPKRSADRALQLIDAVHAMIGLSRFNVLTDHLYNDMPRNFIHAWRGEARSRRDRELEEFLQIPWRPNDLTELLGPVPAALLQAARDGRLLPCLNFDGFHVDLGVCQRTTEYIGAGSLIAITDHIETYSMAGEELHPARDASLWHRADGVVAAGSRGLDWQVENMRKIGLTDPEIRAMTTENPHKVIALGKPVATA
jgi:N-acetylglucosamine-6-phosphate deacetylase